MLPIAEDLSASPVKPEQPTAFRTLAAKKYFDEPLDISIQRKASEQDEADLVQKRAPLLDRYHPYTQDSVQERPVNLVVPQKPWYSAPPPVTTKVQDEPVDFSKKRDEGGRGLDRGRVAPAKRQFQFQRNLLVILLQNINRNPGHGKNIVRYLKMSSDKVQSRGCSGGKNGTPNQQGQQTGGGSSSGGGGGAFSGGGASNGSTGGSLNSSRSNSTDGDEASGNNLFDVSETDFDHIDFDFNESATRKWISDNPDLSPLKVLDHISFKVDPAPDPQQEVNKPPDLGTLDRDTANILQLAVPVPDPSSTFLDIGTDFGPVSFYEDDPFNLEQLVPSTFNLNNMNSSSATGPTATPTTAHHQPLYPIHHQNNNTQHQQQNNILHNLNNSIILQQHNQIRQQHQPQPQQQPAKLTSLDLTSQINFNSFVPDANVSPIRHAVDNHNNIKYAIKTEPAAPPPPQLQQQQQHFFPQIKEEAPHYHADNCCAPASPQTPGGGKIRTSPQRKKSASSSNDEEDLMNVPSLQMRIQILQQRVSLKLSAIANRV